MSADAVRRGPLSRNAQAVLALLSHDPQPVRALRAQTGLDHGQMTNALMRLSERGLAIKSGGGWKLDAPITSDG